MKYLLNIGLDGIIPEPSSVNRDLAPPQGVLIITAEEAVRRYGFKILDTALVRSDTEQTLVCLVDIATDSVAASTFSLACSLNQDCIAVCSDSTREGALYGPRSEAWGEFNPEFFFTLAGDRLSAVIKELAA